MITIALVTFSTWFSETVKLIDNRVVGNCVLQVWCQVDGHVQKQITKMTEDERTENKNYRLLWIKQCC